MKYSMNTDNSSSNNETEDCSKVPSNESLSINNNGSKEKNMKEFKENKDLFVEDLLDELDKLTQGVELNEKNEKHSKNETKTFNTTNVKNVQKPIFETKLVRNGEKENASLETLVCHSSQDLDLKNQEEIANMLKNHENEVKDLQLKLEQQNKEHDIVREQLNEQLSKLEIESSEKQQQYLKTIKSMDNHLKTLRQERDEGVMRFAEAERKREEMRVALEKGELIMKGWGREKETALNRWKAVCDENKRAFDVCKNQKLEIAELKKDIERLTDTMNKHENLARAANSKYQVEVDNHKETSRRLVENVRVVNEVRVESVNLHDIISNIFLTLQELNDRQQTQAPPTNTTANATKVDYNNVLKVLQASKKDLNQLHWKQKEIVAEMLTYKDKIHCLEIEHQARTDELMELKEVAVDHEEVTKLMGQLEDATNRIREYECQLREASNETESMRQRCEESLACNQKLSQINCSLQSQNNIYEKDLAELTEKNAALANFVSSLQLQASSLSQEKETLEKDKDTIISDLRSQLQQTRDKVKSLEVSHKDLNDDVKVMKRRYYSALRDLRKQLAGKDGHDSTSLHSSLSHAESSLSLDNLSNNLLPSSCNSCTNEGNDESKLLIENLQKELNKKNQNLEFLNDHVQKLTKELNLKTKKLRSMQAKKELHTLLADLPEFQTNSTKGQAEVGKMFKVIMEDTLTKNIELKESVKTLGEEIDKLTKENKKLVGRLEENLLVSISGIQVTPETSDGNNTVLNNFSQNDQDHTAPLDSIVAEAVLDLNNNVESKPN